MRGRLTWILSGLFVTVSISASADGSFFARKEIPPIPAQRALITYRDGVERLVIDSLVGGEGRELAWIVPVPAEPTAFRKVSAGLVKTVSVVTAPYVITDKRAAPFLPSVVVIVVVTLLWMRSLVKKRPSTLRFLLSLGELLLLSALALLFGALSGTRGLTRSVPDRTAGVEVTQQVAVGDYDICVLHVERAEGFQQWLAENGFAALPPEGVPAVNDYIRKGWRFVAAKLVRDEEAGVSSHAVEIAFPVAEPVYPMRLTALAKSNVQLELFVLADDGAKAAGLDVEMSLQLKKHANPWPTQSQWPCYGPITHPEFADYAWDGCRLTRLCGVIEPAAMTSDILLEMAPAGDFRRIYYTQAAAIDGGVLAGTRIGVPMCIIGAFLVWLCSRKKDSRLGLRMSLVLLLAMVSGTAVGVHSFSQKQIAVAQEWSVSQWNSAYGTTAELASYYGRWASAGLTKDPVALAESLLLYTVQVNSITGERLRFEDSPGNILLFPSENGIVLREYFYDGFPYDTYFPFIPSPDMAVERGSKLVDSYEAALDRGNVTDMHFPMTYRDVRDLGHSVRLLMTAKKHAAEFRPFAIEELQRMLPIQGLAEKANAQYYINILGFITETVPPLDFSQEAVEDFIKRVSERPLQ